MSFTKRNFIELDILADAFGDGHWLNNATQQEIIADMNRRENICTPGFLMRRQIQQEFPALMQKASAASKIPLSDCANLVTAGNVPWNEKFLRALASALAAETFDDYDATGQARLLERSQWLKYLSDCTLCQRETAIKLIFALKMNRDTAAKFLISMGHTLPSVRNPFDYICTFCLSCAPRIPYNEARKMLIDFEKNRQATFVENPNQKPNITMTDSMKSEMARLAGNDTIPNEVKRGDLRRYMLENSGEFVRSAIKNGAPTFEYASGFSLQNIDRLKKFMSYLALLYPAETPKGGASTVDELIQSMFFAHDIDLLDNHSLRLPSKGAALNAYNRIPFNGDVVLRLKTLATRLRANMRAATHPANAEDISRSTIMILAYFFITGYLYANDEKTAMLIQRLKNDKPAARIHEKKLIDALQFAIKRIDKIADSPTPVKHYRDALNFLLMCFGMTKFYPPFVLDRFIMISLLADPLNAPLRDDYEESLQFLMGLLIDENYREWLTKLRARQYKKKYPAARKSLEKFHGRRELRSRIWLRKRYSEFWEVQNERDEKNR